MEIEKAIKAQQLLCERDMIKEALNDFDYIIEFKVVASIVNPRFGYLRDYIRGFTRQQIISQLQSKLESIEKEIESL